MDDADADAGNEPIARKLALRLGLKVSDHQAEIL